MRPIAGMLFPMLVLVTLSGCSAGGFGLDKADVDPSITTGDVGNIALANPEQRSDEMTIRNAVSSADIELLKTGAPLSWANADTGSRGAIDSLIEEKRNDTLCRRFTTSRESFDGVAVYEGEACMVAPGTWQMREFGPAGS
jgi:17 kDa outer membrane surface antigen